MRFKTMAMVTATGPLGLCALEATAATLVVDQHDPACIALASPFCTITDAVKAAFPYDEIVVEAGNYVENITIDVPVVLLSTGGRSVTIMEGISGAGSLGTIVISPNVDGVQIGDVDRGFTIIGIDNGTPGIENAAIYFQGDHAGAGVIGNKIVANGDQGLLTEFVATITDFEIRENEFAGMTFFPPPAGEVFSQPFTLANVPRQLVVMGGGAGGGNTSDVIFSDNLVTGSSGGVDADGDQQGNTQVTIDAVGAVIRGNAFFGSTTRFGTGLRARGPDTDIANNAFFGAGLSDSACYIFVEEAGDTLDNIKARNIFVDRLAIVDPAPNATTGTICPLRPPRQRPPAAPYATPY